VRVARLERALLRVVAAPVFSLTPIRREVTEMLDAQETADPTAENL
jgi:hypothetical protein